MKEIVAYKEYLRDVKKDIATDLENRPAALLLQMLHGKRYALVS